MDRFALAPLPKYDYSHDQPKGIVMYTNWLSRRVTRFFRISSYFANECINIKSAARAICDLYLNGQKKEQRSIERMINEINKENQQLGIGQVVQSVLLKLEEKQVVEKKTLHEIFEQATEFTSQPSVGDTKELLPLLEKAQATEGLLHLSQETFKKFKEQAILQRWNSIQGKFVEKEIPFKQKVVSALNTHQDIPMDSLDKLEELCEKERRYIALKTSKKPPSLVEAENQIKSAFEEKEVVSINFKNIDEELDFIEKNKLITEILTTDNSLKEEDLKQPSVEDLRIKLQNCIAEAEEKSYTRQLEKAKNNIAATLKLDKKSSDLELVKAVIDSDVHKKSLLKDAMFVINDFILNAPPDKELQEPLNMYISLLNIDQNFLRKNLNDLLERGKEKQGLLEKVETFFIKQADPAFIGPLSQTPIPENLHPSLYKILASRNDVPLPIRLSASAMKKDPALLANVLTTTPDNKIKEILSNLSQILRDKDASWLKDAFVEFTNTTPERVNSIQESAYENRKTTIGKALASALGLNFDPISPKEALFSPQSRNLPIFHAPHGKEGVDIEECRKFLTFRIAELRNAHPETSPTALHPLFIGTEGAFTAKDIKDAWAKLNELAQLSEEFPSVTLIPGEISINNTELHIVPVFEGGRLIAMSGKPAQEGIDPIFLLPNGVSIALGIGEQAIESTNHAKRNLPVNQQNIDILLLLRQNTKEGGITSTPQLTIDSASDALSVEKGESLVSNPSQGVTLAPLQPLVYSGAPVLLNTICTTQELNEIRAILGREKLRSSEDVSQDSFLQLVEKRFQLTEKQKEELVKALDEKDEKIITSKYATQFFSLLSQVKKTPIILYTGNPAVPVQIFNNGVRCIDDPDVFQDEKTAEGSKTSEDGKTVVGSASFYITDDKFFSIKPPHTFPEYQQAQATFQQQKQTIYQSLKNCIDEAAKGNLKLDLINELKRQCEKFERVYHRNSSFAELLCKSQPSLTAEFDKLVETVDLFQNFYKGNLALKFSTQNFRKGVQELLDQASKIKNDVKECFKITNEEEVAKIEKNLCYPIRVLDTAVNLVALGITKEGELANAIFYLKDGSLHFQEGQQAPPLADDVAKILKELKEGFKVLAQSKDIKDKDRKAIRDGITNLLNKYAQLHSIPDDLSRTAREIKEFFEEKK